MLGKKKEKKKELNTRLSLHTREERKKERKNGWGSGRDRLIKKRRVPSDFRLETTPH